MTGSIFIILFSLSFMISPCRGKINLPPGGDTIVVDPGTARVEIAWTFNDKITSRTVRAWSFNDKELASSFRSEKAEKTNGSLLEYDIESDATLVLKNVDNRYNGTYKFSIAEGLVITDTSEVTVFIAEKPTLTTCSSPVTGNEGDNITCSCQGEGGNPPYPVNITWFKNGEKIGEVKQYINLLTLNNVSMSDIGMYTCRAETHPRAKNEKTIQVNVKLNFAPEKPKLTFTSNPAELDKMIEITCKAEALPTSSYTISHNVTIIVSNSSTYKIEKVDYIHAGNYKCVARNKLGTSETDEDLKVVGKLTSTKPTTKSTTENGSKTNEDTEVTASGTKKGLGVGAIVGIVIGVLVLLVVIIVLVWWRKNKEKERQCGNAIVNSGNNDPANAYESVNEGPKAGSNTAGGNTSGNPPANANQPVVYATVDKNRKNEPAVTYATLDTMAMQPNGSKRENEPPRAQTEYASIQFEGLKGDLV